MAQPKFAIGEEVILVSRTYPKLSGEYIVEDMQEIPPYGSHICKWSGVLYHQMGENYLYKLEGFDYYYEDGVRGFSVRESSLRKKHKPADDEFQEWFKIVVDGKNKGKVVAKD